MLGDPKELMRAQRLHAPRKAVPGEVLPSIIIPLHHSRAVLGV